MVELPQLRIAECIGVLGPATVARVGALVAHGSAKMATFAEDVPMHGQGKSSMVAALIGQADAKRRCVEATQLDGSQV